MIFSSSGNNELNSTNKVETNIINDLYESCDYISSKGYKTNLKIDFKNSNVVGKKTQNTNPVLNLNWLVYLMLKYQFLYKNKIIRYQIF